LVLYILADLISFLEIQRLQLAGSSSTVFAANLILNDDDEFTLTANEAGYFNLFLSVVTLKTAVIYLGRCWSSINLSKTR